jgi:hypothetical protein
VQDIIQFFTLVVDSMRLHGTAQQILK